MTKKNDTIDDGIVILIKPHKKGKFAVGLTTDYKADTPEKEMFFDFAQALCAEFCIRHYFKSGFRNF